MPNVEFDRPHSLITPYLTIPLNQPDPDTGYLFQIQDDYKIVPSLRVSQDAMSQRDGSVLHPRFKTGLVASFSLEYLIGIPGSIDTQPACDNDLRQMHEMLTGAMNSIRELTPSNQRLSWSPTGVGDRMLDFVQALAWPDPSYSNGTRVALSLETPFPYAIDVLQTETDISDGAGTTTLTNDGTADFYPVMKVLGPTTAFTITNTTTGLAVVYDSSRPGALGISGGDYAEIDFFRGTIFLNGSSSDLIAGLDPTSTDLFPLVYEGGGVNDIEITGADVQILWNRAWS
jgi:hypothetical protein